MKYWRTRLVLMPVSRDYTIKNIESGQRKCDSRQEMSHEDFFLYVEHFVRFLIMLNKVTRVRQPGNDCIHRVGQINCDVLLFKDLSPPFLL